MNMGFWSGVIFGCCIGAVITFFTFMISEIRTETKQADKQEFYKFVGGTELFTMVGKIGYEVRFRTPSFEKFRAAEEACRRVLDGKENEDV